MGTDRLSKGREMLALAAMAIGALSCTNTLPTSSAPPEAARAEVLAAITPEPVTRPMTMRLTVTLQGPVPAPSPECLIAHQSSVLEGYATHLGHFRGTGSTCILSVVPDPDPPFLPAGPPPYFTAPFTNPLWVLTAADGDELWLKADDAVAVLTFNPDDGSETSLRARGTHHIIGGTGRFARATGELQTTAVNEDGQGPDEARSVGWIRY